MNTKDIVKSLDDMTAEELLALAEQIRSERKIRKPSGRRAKSAKRQSVNAAEKLRGKLAKLSPEERKALIAQMRG